MKKNTIALGGLMASGSLLAKSPAVKHKFRLCLNPGNIGVSLDQRGLLDAAIKYGYRAISPQPNNLKEMSPDERAKLVEDMKSHDITFGSTNLPVDFRNDDKAFQESIKTLPELCEILREVGGTRLNTWVMPTHQHFTYMENFKKHRDRLKTAGNIAGHYGIRVGLEYVGPKKTMARAQYSFVRTMAEMKELIAAMGEPNIGFVLDSFHWYCCNETKTDILTLDKSDVVTVDLNDAREGFTRDTQVDGKREMPLATGVIPIADFVRGLAEIGYDGPVRSEPFNQAIRDMEDDAAIQKNFDLMTEAMNLAND